MAAIAQLTAEKKTRNKLSEESFHKLHQFSRQRAKVHEVWALAFKSHLWKSDFSYLISIMLLNLFSLVSLSDYDEYCLFCRFIIRVKAKELSLVSSMRQILCR